MKRETKAFAMRSNSLFSSSALGLERVTEHNFSIGKGRIYFRKNMPGMTGGKKRLTPFELQDILQCRNAADTHTAESRATQLTRRNVSGGQNHLKPMKKEPPEGISEQCHREAR